MPKNNSLDNDPLFVKPMEVEKVSYKDNELTITLSQYVNPNWIQALKSMPSFQNTENYRPQSFTFNGNEATVQVREAIVDHVLEIFETWMPLAHERYKEIATQQFEAQLAKDRAEEERKSNDEEVTARLNKKLKKNK